MSYFEKILVPVDFTVNTGIAVTKAMELCVPGLSSIQLVHVSEAGAGVQKKLDQLAYETSCSGNITVAATIIQGSKVEGNLISYIRDKSFDLVVIGKNNYHSFFPFLNTVISANIAEETKCPVLTVKPGSLRKKLETVVMPLGDCFPRRKIELLATLNRRKNLHVHLLTILGKDQHHDNHSASALLQSMRSLKERLKCNVHHCIVHSNNKAMATLRYAEKINADILLVSPETESTITSWMSKKDINDIVKPASQLQVLSVQPN